MKITIKPPADHNLALAADRWLQKNTDIRCMCIAPDVWSIADVEGIATGWGIIALAEAKGFVSLIVESQESN